jgi:hypothetical protein
MKYLQLEIVISQTDIFEHRSTDVYLNKKTGKLNFGFVKGVFDYNQQVELKVGDTVIFSTMDEEKQPTAELLKEVVNQFNIQ